MDTAHHIDQDPKYPTYPIGGAGFINTMKTESLGYELFEVFQPGTLNPEPLDLGDITRPISFFRKVESEPGIDKAAWTEYHVPLSISAAALGTDSYVASNPWSVNRSKKVVQKPSTSGLTVKLRVREEITLTLQKPEGFRAKASKEKPAGGGRIISCLIDEQRSQAGWIGSLNYEVIF